MTDVTEIIAELEETEIPLALRAAAALATHAAQIEALRAERDALREAVTLAANRLDLWHVSAIASGNETLRCKLANWCEETRGALGEPTDGR